MELSLIHIYAFLMHDSDVPNPDLSVRLGIVCHFLTDFFCFAHTNGFTGTMREHIRYEKELDRYLRNFCAAQFHSCRTGTDPVLKSASAALENLEQLQDAFLSQPHAFETDVRYSLHAVSYTHLYKTAFFVLRAVSFLRTGSMPPTKQALLPLLEEKEREILQICMNWEAFAQQRKEHPEFFFELLLDWCGKVLAEQN